MRGTQAEVFGLYLIFFQICWEVLVHVEMGMRIHDRKMFCGRELRHGAGFGLFGGVV